MLACLSVSHGFLPPHPSPASLVAQFDADMGKTLIYGICIAIPAIIVAGPVFFKDPETLNCFVPAGRISGCGQAGVAAAWHRQQFVVLFAAGSAADADYLVALVIQPTPVVKNVLDFLGDPSIILLLAIGTATYTLGIRGGMTIKKIMQIYEEAAKDISMILLIVAGAGALEEVFLDSGVSKEIAGILQEWPVHPLVLGWLIAAIIRVCLGSATVAGLTAAAISFPLMNL